MKASLKACDVVIFGGGGDLAMRKLLPALYHLELDGLLAPTTRIVGASRREMSAEDYQNKVRSALDEYVPSSVGDDKMWPRFKDRLSYVSVDAQKDSDFTRFNDHQVGGEGRDVVFYLATSPDLFGSICYCFLASHGLNKDRMRVVLEKPLGRDLPSSKAINDEVMENFVESQVFRIDHYLGKETVQNLLAIRFGNTLFEPLWDSAHIDNIQITVSETVGVEDRWGYYDNAGAMRDMVQNHIVQLLCLVAMEPPGRMDSDSVRDEKIKVLKALRPIVGANAYTKTVRGQYAKGMINGKSVPGYFDEEGSNPESRTETFVALRADIDNWRWAGCLYLRTGKRLGQRYSEIVIQYKTVPHSIFSDESNRQLQRNQLVIRLQPEEKISLTVMNKVPGTSEGMNLQPVDLNLSLTEAFHNKRSPEAYERLLLDVMRNDATLFMRYDEVEAAWKWVDGIMAAWNQTSERPKEYASGSWGPAASMALPIKDGRNWHDY